MNWYYQRRVGLDMYHFWRRILPVIGVGVLAAGACLIGSEIVPVSGWGSFIGWGLVYTAVYAALCWAFVLDAGERSSIGGRLKRVLGH